MNADVRLTAVCEERTHIEREVGALFPCRCHYHCEWFVQVSAVKLGVRHPCFSEHAKSQFQYINRLTRDAAHTNFVMQT